MQPARGIAGRPTRSKGGLARRAPAGGPGREANAGLSADPAATGRVRREPNGQSTTPVDHRAHQTKTGWKASRGP